MDESLPRRSAEGAKAGLPRRSAEGAKAGLPRRSAEGAKAGELMPLVYDELRRLAANYLRHERPGQTLQATALVHEAFLRLSREKNQPWKNRTHFLAIAALSMRQILVQRARARQADKRGGAHVERIALDESVIADESLSRHSAERADASGVDVLALDSALDKLAALDPQQAKIVEMRYFGGLTVEEAADALGISPATVKRHWTIARAWLKHELAPDVPPRDGVQKGDAG
jgi:RNA polymerase sigma factor (TIGR02999 family)